LRILANPTPVKAIILMCILLFQTFIQKTDFGSQIFFLKSMDELIVLFCLPFTIKFVLERGLTDIKLKTFLFLFVIYLTLALISSIFGSGNLTQFVYQLVLDSKFIIVFLFCYGAYRENTSERYFATLMKILVIVNIPFVLLQLGFPSVYDAIFPQGAHHGKFFNSEGQTSARTAGMFWFTGQLAFFMAIAAGFFSIQLFVGKRARSNYFYLLISCTLLLSTLSRGEIMAFLISGIFTYIFFISHKKIKPLYFLCLPLGLIFFSVVNHHLVVKSLTEVGILESVERDVAPRAKMLIAAIDEANENFPLGAGLGTLGGQAAVVADSDLFYKHGFQYEWYFVQGMYLTDTYWPKVIAETGWFGFILLCVMYLYFPFLYVKSPDENTAPLLFNFFAGIALFINSLSSPVYNSAIMVFLVFFLVGYRPEIKHKSASYE
jgi:hypothetical protein